MNKRKTDRTARLFKLEQFLHQNKAGVTLEQIEDEIAPRLDNEELRLSRRQIYRDLETLEKKVGIPIHKDGNRFCIVEGYHLPPIHFSLPEAMNIFLAARLMLSYAHHDDQYIRSAFFKLNCVVPSPIKEQIQNTLLWMQQLPSDNNYRYTIEVLADAWGNQRTVRISYLTLGEERPKERDIDPYFIEPAAAGHSSYVIAYCHLAKGLRVFKIKRIQSIKLTERKYTVADEFDANKFFASSWGIVASGEVETVRLKFSPDVAQILKEVIWHPSQIVETRNDGSLLMTLKVIPGVELLGWIMGWGENVEVLEPAKLRDRVKATVKAMAKVYG